MNFKIKKKKKIKLNKVVLNCFFIFLHIFIKLFVIKNKLKHVYIITLYYIIIIYACVSLTLLENL